MDEDFRDAQAHTDSIPRDSNGGRLAAAQGAKLR
jgi:hypothetical protein